MLDYNELRKRVGKVYHEAAGGSSQSIQGELRTPDATLGSVKYKQGIYDGITLMYEAVLQEMRQLWEEEK